jgi:hypothetical protein
MLPPRWEQGVTGKGTARWAVRQDASAPSRPHVLQQSGSGTFPWCVLPAAAIGDGYVATKFKPITGKQDQAGGGVVWRWKNGDNYYVARANALENNVSLYYTELSGMRIRVSLDGKTYIDTQDAHIAGTGAVGLWSKADSVTSFDDFVYGERP